jgi:hypothetical protein
MVKFSGNAGVMRCLAFLCSKFCLKVSFTSSAPVASRFASCGLKLRSFTGPPCARIVACTDFASYDPMSVGTTKTRPCDTAVVATWFLNVHTGEGEGSRFCSVKTCNKSLPHTISTPPHLHRGGNRVGCWRGVHKCQIAVNLGDCVTSQAHIGCEDTPQSMFSGGAHGGRKRQRAD